MSELLIFVLSLVALAVLCAATGRRLRGTRQADPNHTDYDALYRSQVGGSR